MMIRTRLLQGLSPLWAMLALGCGVVTDDDSASQASGYLGEQPEVSAPPALAAFPAMVAAAPLPSPAPSRPEPLLGAAQRDHVAPDGGQYAYADAEGDAGFAADDRAGSTPDYLQCTCNDQSLHELCIDGDRSDPADVCASTCAHRGGTSGSGFGPGSHYCDVPDQD